MSNQNNPNGGLSSASSEFIPNSQPRSGPPQFFKSSKQGKPEGDFKLERNQSQIVTSSDNQINAQSSTEPKQVYVARQ